MEFKVFNKEDFIKESFEMLCIVQLKNGHYYEVKIIRLINGRLIAGTYSRESKSYKPIEIKKIRYYAVID